MNAESATNAQTPRYEYTLDLNGETAKAKVARLVGRGKRVLEIGCASGAMTRCLVGELGCSVTGIEINEADAELSAPLCTEMLIGDIEQLDLATRFAPCTFDVITFADVLEHLRDPVAALRRVRPLLKPEGYVAVSVPNIAHAGLVFELAKGRFEYRPLGLLDDTHIRFFTKQSLLWAFERAGYAVTQVDRTVLDPQHTEFDVTPADEAERSLLQYLLNKHPESRTYQFVVKGVPIGDEDGRVSAAIDAMQAQMHALQARLDEESKRRKTAESQLRWMERRSPLTLLRRVLGKAT